MADTHNTECGVWMLFTAFLIAHGFAHFVVEMENCHRTILRQIITLWIDEEDYPFSSPVNKQPRIWLNALSDQQKQRVQALWNPQPQVNLKDDWVLAGDQPLTLQDAKSLCPTDDSRCWLTDQVVNAFLNRTRNSAAKWAGTVIHSTFFSQKVSTVIREKKPLETLLNWDRQESVESMLVPVNHQDLRHWALLHVDLKARETIVYHGTTSDEDSRTLWTVAIENISLFANWRIARNPITCATLESLAMATCYVWNSTT